MLEWFKQLFSDPKTAFVVLTSGAIGFVIGGLQGVIQVRHDGWSGLAGAVASGMLVALLVGLGIQDYIRSEGVRLCVIGGCAVIAPDIIAGLKALGQGLRSDPIGFLIRLFEAVRGVRPKTLDNEGRQP